MNALFWGRYILGWGEGAACQSCNYLSAWKLRDEKHVPKHLLYIDQFVSRTSFPKYYSLCPFRSAAGIIPGASGQDFFRCNRRFRRSFKIDEV